MPDTIELFKDLGPVYLPREFDYHKAFTDNRYYVFDTETSLIKKNSNIYVNVPEFVLGIEYLVTTPIPILVTENIKYFIEQCKDCTKNNYIIIGHSLPFDLNVVGYIPTNETMLWDTALFHYLWTNQRDTFPSLELTAKYWLGVSYTKESEVLEMIKAGIDPKDIPKDKLAAYCEQDVKLTKDIFLKQFEAFSKADKAWQNMVINQMHWLKNVYRMSKIGLKLDAERIKTSIQDIEGEIEDLTDACIKFMSRVFHETVVATHTGLSGYDFNFEVNPMSNKQIETVVWGGKFDIVTYEEVGIYKTGSRAGQAKFKKNISTINVPITLPHKGTMSVDSKTLEEIKTRGISKDFREFLDNLLTLRDLNKTQSTYFVGYLEQADSNGVIHSEMKHVGTPTGRLSSTKPNIQNLKGDE